MAQFTVVNVVPQTHSDEQNQDSEPSVSVNPADPTQILISAFTPPDTGKTNGPLYYSQDGGQTWNVTFIVPGGMPLDQTYDFGGISGEFYGGDINGTSNPPFTVILNSLSTPNPFTPTTMATLENPTPTDQPYIAAATVRYGPDTGKDRFYVGYNDQRVAATTGQTAAIDFCLDATVASPVISTVHLDARATADWSVLGITPPFHQDGPQVRTAVHADGTIYAVFNGVRTMDAAGNSTSDIVVVRDDNWASGGTPFTALVDPHDGKAGYRVQTGVALLWSPLSATIGQERAFGCFAIATHPGDSDIVYIAWAEITGGQQTIHVQRSLNRGVTWSGDLITPIPNGINATLAISSTGVIGLMYQQLTGSGSQQWETHFAQSTNGTTWTDTTVCTTPADTPLQQFLPYLGDYMELKAFGKNFYGTFCANNTPDPANFPATPAGVSNPNGAIYGRNVTTSSPWNLIGSDHVTVVPASIDPYFLNVVEVAASSDFYVRDWTASTTSGDNGVEPSTDLDFWDASDVWNQNSTSTPLPPDPNDVPHTESALSGGNNYGFARIRRNELPASGSGSVTVTAHFLISEFGTKSNFVDDFFSDPTDPDVTFVTGDVTVNFAETDLGPKVSPFSEWSLAPTSSDHLCIAVEINSTADPFASPGLTGRAPGQPGTTLSVIDDNNKAQRNLHVTTTLGGTRTIGFGIVHNSATFARDMTLGLVGTTSPPEGTLIEVFTDKGVVDRIPWQSWGGIVLRAMQPGENRWVGITVPKLPASGTTTVTLGEMSGARPANGFSMGWTIAPAATVIGYLTGYHERVLKRLHLGFGIPTGEGTASKGERDEDRDRFGFEEHVRVEDDGLRIEVDVRVHRGDDDHERRRKVLAGSKTPDEAHYEEWLRSQVTLLTKALAALGGSDPFGIGAAIGQIEAAGTGDLAALTSAHAGVLDRFDAMMTMQQKATGDRADILQMALWNRDLLARSAVLAALSGTPAMRNHLGHFIRGVETRKAKLSDYGALLGDLSPGFQQIATDLGASAQLRPLITALSGAGSARTQQKAHRDLLLALQQLV